MNFQKLEEEIRQRCVGVELEVLANEMKEVAEQLQDEFCTHPFKQEDVQEHVSDLEVLLARVMVRLGESTRR